MLRAYRGLKPLRASSDNPKHGRRHFVSMGDVWTDRGKDYFEAHGRMN